MDTKYQIAFDKVASIANYYNISDVNVMLRIMKQYNNLKIKYPNITCMEILNIVYDKIYPNIYDLPPEILPNILSRLSFQDKKNLQLAYEYRQDLYQDTYLFPYHKLYVYTSWPYLKEINVPNNCPVVKKMYTFIKNYKLMILDDIGNLWYYNDNWIVIEQNVKNFIVQFNNSKIELITYDNTYKCYAIDKNNMRIIEEHGLQQQNVQALYTNCVIQNGIIKKDPGKHSNRNNIQNTNKIPVAIKLRYNDILYIQYDDILILHPSQNPVQIAGVKHVHDGILFGHDILLINGILMRNWDDSHEIYLINKNIYYTGYKYVLDKNGMIKSIDSRDYIIKENNRLQIISIDGDFNTKMLDDIYINYEYLHLMIDIRNKNLQISKIRGYRRIHAKLLTQQELELITSPSFNPDNIILEERDNELYWNIIG